MSNYAVEPACLSRLVFLDESDRRPAGTVAIGTSDTGDLYVLDGRGRVRRCPHVGGRATVAAESLGHFVALTARAAYDRRGWGLRQRIKPAR